MAQACRPCCSRLSSPPARPLLAGGGCVGDCVQAILRREQRRNPCTPHHLTRVKSTISTPAPSARRSCGWRCRWMSSRRWRRGQRRRRRWRVPVGAVAADAAHLLGRAGQHGRPHPQRWPLRADAGGGHFSGARASGLRRRPDPGVDGACHLGACGLCSSDRRRCTLRGAYCAWLEMIGFTHVTKLSERWTAAHSKAAAEAIPET